MAPPRSTKTQRIARAKLARHMMYLNSEVWLPATIKEDVPEAWHTLEQDLDVAEPKQKITLYVDQSVAKFYQAMGKGYHERINRLLATWAQMKIAEELQVDALLQRRIASGDDG